MAFTLDGRLIAVDKNGRIFVIDQGNLRIVLYSLPEIMNHLAAAQPKQ